MAQHGQDLVGLGVPDTPSDNTDREGHPQVATGQRGSSRDRTESLPPSVPTIRATKPRSSQVTAEKAGEKAGEVTIGERLRLVDEFMRLKQDGCDISMPQFATMRKIDLSQFRSWYYAIKKQREAGKLVTDLTRKRNRQPKYLEIDNEMLQWMAKQEDPATVPPADIRAESLEVAKRLGIEVGGNGFSASDSWIKGFQKRCQQSFGLNGQTAAAAAAAQADKCTGERTSKDEEDTEDSTHGNPLPEGCGPCPLSAAPFPACGPPPLIAGSSAPASATEQQIHSPHRHLPADPQSTLLTPSLGSQQSDPLEGAVVQQASASASAPATAAGVRSDLNGLSEQDQVRDEKRSHVAAAAAAAHSANCDENPPPNTQTPTPSTREGGRLSDSIAHVAGNGVVVTGTPVPSPPVQVREGNGAAGLARERPPQTVSPNEQTHDIDRSNEPDKRRASSTSREPAASAAYTRDVQMGGEDGAGRQSQCSEGNNMDVEKHGPDREEKRGALVRPKRPPPSSRSGSSSKGASTNIDPRPSQVDADTGRRQQPPKKKLDTGNQLASAPSNSNYDSRRQPTPTGFTLVAQGLRQTGQGLLKVAHDLLHLELRRVPGSQTAINVAVLLVAVLLLGCGFTGAVLVGLAIVLTLSIPYSVHTQREGTAPQVTDQQLGPLTVADDHSFMTGVNSGEARPSPPVDQQSGPSSVMAESVSCRLDEDHGTNCPDGTAPETVLAPPNSSATNESDTQQQTRKADVYELRRQSPALPPARVSGSDGVVLELFGVSSLLVSLKGLSSTVPLTEQVVVQAIDHQLPFIASAIYKNREAIDQREEEIFGQLGESMKELLNRLKPHVAELDQDVKNALNRLAKKINGGAAAASFALSESVRGFFHSFMLIPSEKWDPLLQTVAAWTVELFTRCPTSCELPITADMYPPSHQDGCQSALLLLSRGDRVSVTDTDSRSTKGWMYGTCIKGAKTGHTGWFPCTIVTFDHHNNDEEKQRKQYHSSCSSLAACRSHHNQIDFADMERRIRVEKSIGPIASLGLETSSLRMFNEMDDVYVDFNGRTGLVKIITTVEQLVRVEKNLLDNERWLKETADRETHHHSYAPGTRVIIGSGGYVKRVLLPDQFNELKVSLTRQTNTDHLTALRQEVKMCLIQQAVTEFSLQVRQSCLLVSFDTSAALGVHANHLRAFLQQKSLSGHVEVVVPHGAEATGPGAGGMGVQDTPLVQGDPTLEDMTNTRTYHFRPASVPLPECPICLCEVEEEEVGLRLFCGHTYHQECLANQIHHVKEGHVPVVCHQHGCGSPVSLPEIRRALKGDRELMESFFKAASQHYINANSRTRFGVCLTADCPQIYSLEDRDVKPIFRCNVCKGVLCKTCCRSHDETLTCEEFNTVDPTSVLLKYLASLPGGGLLCPKCGVGIERSGGCKFVRCRCGTDLCILCGYVCRTTHEEHSCIDAGFSFLPEPTCGDRAGHLQQGPQPRLHDRGESVPGKDQADHQGPDRPAHPPEPAAGRLRLDIRDGHVPGDGYVVFRRQQVRLWKLWDMATRAEVLSQP
ncbi:unnamed protein product [Vitrella brassicaformis CCMP3155]|uniref:RING-type domain-containing protein n=3 Tax=Vitrella brassicaformis TaxID=1169539 RepID=A0A0G4GTQ9_VITBC|nr:unnamed protein product [Vitrella brassicaformis CCMP3155]|eukprot:CEM33896.1 unnamed protein product [Vitrella brassicaformis CCMP3155]